MSVANNACWAIGELAIKVRATLAIPCDIIHGPFYWISIIIACGLTSLSACSFTTCSSSLLTCIGTCPIAISKLYLFGQWVLSVLCLKASHTSAHYYCKISSVTIPWQIGKEISPVVISVVSCLVPILTTPEVIAFFPIMFSMRLIISTKCVVCRAIYRA